MVGFDEILGLVDGDALGSRLVEGLSEGDGDGSLEGIEESDGIVDGYDDGA
jgi:hypothetical protein